MCVVRVVRNIAGCTDVLKKSVCFFFLIYPLSYIIYDGVSYKYFFYDLRTYEVRTNFKISYSNTQSYSVCIRSMILNDIKKYMIQINYKGCDLQLYEGAAFSTNSESQPEEDSFEY